MSLAKAETTRNEDYSRQPAHGFKQGATALVTALALTASGCTSSKHRNAAPNPSPSEVPVTCSAPKITAGSRHNGYYTYGFSVEPTSKPTNGRRLVAVFALYPFIGNSTDVRLPAIDSSGPADAIVEMDGLKSLSYLVKTAIADITNTSLSPGAVTSTTIDQLGLPVYYCPDSSLRIPSK